MSYEYIFRLGKEKARDILSWGNSTKNNAQRKNIG